MYQNYTSWISQQYPTFLNRWTFIKRRKGVRQFCTYFFFFFFIKLHRSKGVKSCRNISVSFLSDILISSFTRLTSHSHPYSTFVLLFPPLYHFCQICRPQKVVASHEDRSEETCPRGQTRITCSTQSLELLEKFARLFARVTLRTSAGTADLPRTTFPFGPSRVEYLSPRKICSRSRATLHACRCAKSRFMRVSTARRERFDERTRDKRSKLLVGR